MSFESIVMMIVAMAIIWGGLGVAVFNLLHAESPQDRD